MKKELVCSNCKTYREFDAPEWGWRMPFEFLQEGWICTNVELFEKDKAEIDKAYRSTIYVVCICPACVPDVADKLVKLALESGRESC